MGGKGEEKEKEWNTKPDYITAIKGENAYIFLRTMKLSTGFIP